MLPCLVECFNSDEMIHPDIYDQHANILFGKMDQLILYLGTDSLGSAVQWTDGQTVYAPTSGSVRSIVPGVRQTASLPITKLKVTSPNIGQQSFSSFGVATNRKKSNASSPVWVTGTLSLDPITQQVTSSTTTQTNRQLNKVSRSIV